MSGGSTKISFLAGVAIGLHDRHEYDTYVGTSSGAILAFCLANGKRFQVERKAMSFKITDVFKDDPNSIKGKLKAIGRGLTKNYLFDQSRLKETIRNVVDQYDFYKWRNQDSTPDALVCAVCVETGAIVLKDLKTVDYEEALDWVMASSSVPVFTKPILINGLHYADGGLREHLPLASYLEEFYNQDDTIDAVFSRPKELNNVVKYPKGIIGMLRRSLTILNWEVSKNDEEVGHNAYGMEINNYFAPKILIEGTYTTTLKQNRELFVIGKRTSCI